MFEVTGNKGVHITFPNGYTISIQWGAVNYCDNHVKDIEWGKPVPASSTAETAIKDPEDEFVQYKGDVVQGNQTVTEVLATMNYVAGLT